ncbi:receptor-activated Ca2+-permeable cation channel [Rhodocollybia butyracea]|uniref:Receptor-activated Ca2+-permeable cation channel n=1 Tax=Rhodocollybia butyracea TaxID=206335 RepID=A0A9P5Q5X3_9AGAR|nr:receptor-activated Ca2+-permeable cation channel [Rhodocollybia butyracea]
MSESQPLLLPREVEATPVYPIIHSIRSDIIVCHFIDTPLSHAALTAPDLTYTLIRPLVEKYGALQRDGNMSIVFCFLLNRVYFLRDQNMASSSVSRTRAELCEILAIRTLREYGNNLLELAVVLTTSWFVFSGADQTVMQMARDEREDLEERVGNAIEMAILGKSKRFIKSSSCQKVIDSIWSGKCVYQAESSHSILSDTYKRNPIHFYDPHKAPLLDHYRLKVPFIRSLLEYINFLILFVLFVLAIEWNIEDKLNAPEITFMIYALGFCLEKVAAMQEHGIQVYFKGTWNGFDLAFVTTFMFYAILRVYGVFYHSLWARSTGIDCLALIACLMFPRLAFVTLRDNLMVLSLRAMISQFVVLMLIAAFCFGGFLYALWTLSRNAAQYSAGTIAWWMLDLWFGLDASGFDRATQFHQVFGPVLMVTYAMLSNTLLLTVLVSILSNTFATINEDAAAEAMFRKAVSTIEGVKADSLFSYQPPVNLIALCFMLPLSYTLTPRWFHKVNVFMIRTMNLPVLLVIALYERQAKLNGTTGLYETIIVMTEKAYDSLPRQLKRLSIFEGLAGSDGDIDAIFEIEEELDTSALDTREDIEIFPRTGDKPAVSLSPPTTPSKRRVSASSNRRPSNSSPSQRRSSNSSQRRPSMPQSHVHFSNGPSSSTSADTGSQGHLIPRNRAESIMNRGMEAAQSFTSPLAQLYQPLIVDDQLPINDSVEHSAPPTGPPLSYGQTARRRLSSMQGHRRTTSEIGGQRQTQNRLSPRSPQETFPSMQEVMSGTDGVLSESPPGLSPRPEGSDLPTAGQVQEEEGHSGGIMQWSERLGKLEERQERIEKLLETIAKSLEESSK